MFARLTCNPPLGQTTTVQSGKQSVTFTVLVESASQRPWEVSLWHNFNDTDQWSGLALSSVDAPVSVLTVSPHPAATHRQWYSGTLSGAAKHTGPVSFTVTFRASQDEPWKWANEQFSTSDGRIVYRTPDAPSEDLSHYIDGIPESMNQQIEKSDTPDTLLWSLTSRVKAAQGQTSGYSNRTLGKPTNFSRWFALVRLWSPWLAPRHGRNEFRPDKEAILAAFERQDGTHLVILAVSGVDDVLTTLNHDGHGHITIHSRNDSEKEGEIRIIMAVGNSVEFALAAAMYHARRMLMKYDADTDEVSKDLKALQEGFKPEWLENWYDGLAYCTWNGLGQQLHEDKIFEALDSLKKNDINISSLIIDDNWQSLNHEGGNQFENGWMEFEATKTGFPRGLAAAVKDIRSKHPDLKHIAVWHALFGYWGGIAPSGKLAQEYKTTVVKKKDGVSGGEMVVIAQQDVSRFYHDFYQFLSSSGVDSVKTDAQFFIDELASASDRHALTRTYQDEWSINALRFFSGRAISCMSQSPQIIFHSQLPSNKPRLLLRNSDDFFPEVPASHPWHIFCNAHNAIFNSYLNILPDWDMFQTSHSYGSFHAAARCVSGGPIYITDIPGKHDIDLIRQMTANTPRGDTVILRPHTVGKSISAYNSYDDPVLLKVATYVGQARTGTSILGVFNCTQRPITELITLSQFPGAEEGEYVIRSHTSGNVTPPTTSAANNVFVDLELQTQGWEILSAYPIQTFELKRAKPVPGPSTIKIAILGLLGKMTGAAAIVNSDSYVDEETGRLRVWTSLKALGTFGLYVSDLKERSVEEDFMAVIFGRPIAAHCVRRSERCEDVLEIDLVRAWVESGSRAGWSNEVALEVVIR